ncbi:hypothetical protein [Streptodolium elevatio]|uniref:Uncharacterized protein n=1 Tax=Streptodolium elevatio TaxID=3157996 RepID=A0ABV3DBM7_9ACTN
MYVDLTFGDAGEFADVSARVSGAARRPATNASPAAIKGLSAVRVIAEGRELIGMDLNANQRFRQRFGYVDCPSVNRHIGSWPTRRLGAE